MTRIFTIILLLTLVSCRKEIEPKVPYFKFDIIGQELLSGLNLNDTLKFEGSNGSSRHYSIFKMEPVKQDVQDCSWNLGTCVTYYHFDFLRIYFIRTDTIPPPPNSPLTASLTKQMQLPLNVDKKNLPKDIQAKVIIYGGLVDFNALPQTGPGRSSPSITFPDYYQTFNFTSYSNSVRTYTEVSIIKSGNNSVYVDPINGTNYTVNEVWFDKKYGLVFFKDVFGNSWSRIN